MSRYRIVVEFDLHDDEYTGTDVTPRLAELTQHVESSLIYYPRNYGGPPLYDVSAHCQEA